MIQIEKTEVYGWEAAIRGMRNPMNSWDKSDSYYEWGGEDFTVGDNDLDLMKRLAKGGSVHAKYRRMINVTVDITAPLYWWKEFDTYKVGTVANSCSTMHKLPAKEFEFEDFSTEHLYGDYDCDNGYNPTELFKHTLDILNHYRRKYLDCTVSKFATVEECEEAKKEFWWQMIQLLPSSYNQKRTVQMNYEVLVGMYRDRKNHKLDEWQVLCEWIESLPYSELITGNED